MKSKSTTLKLIVIGVVVLLSCAYLLPIYVMVTTSLKSLAEINQRTYLALGSDLQFQNYVDAWDAIQPALVNSSLISFAVTFLCLLVGGLGGYYLSRSRSLTTRIL